MGIVLLILAWVIPMLGCFYKLWITLNNPSIFFCGDEIRENFSHRVIASLIPILNAFHLLIMSLEFSKNEKGLKNGTSLDRWLLKKFSNKKDKI